MSKPATYVVQPGDSLGEIAYRFDVWIADLLKANDLKDTDYLEVGQRLVIP